MKDDMISRQAALNVIDKLACTPSQWIVDGNKVFTDAIKALPSATDTNVGGNLIDRQAAIDICANAIDLWHGQLGEGALVAVRDKISGLPSAQPGQRNARVFQGIVVEYPSISAYPEYEGKPYFSIKYTENGQEFIGYGTYKPEVLSEYLKEYFMPPAQPGWIPVTERLPRPNEEDGNGFYKAYLVQDGRWMDVARWDGKYWVAWGYSTVLLNVVAWCELPTPYRKGGQDGEG